MIKTRKAITASKVSKYEVISGPFFPVFRLNTDIYGVNLHKQSEYSKIQTRNNSVFGHFSRSECVTKSESYGGDNPAKHTLN